MAPYRPPGRSNRSGRSNADNDVFEGLPVKQWGQSYSRVSLAPPISEAQDGNDDNKWAEPPMPRDYQLLLPWTQYLLRLARSGKVGTKRKHEADAADEDRPEDEATEEAAKAASTDERGYIAKKWKLISENMLVPEHKHFEFLAKRRKGLPSLYSPDQLDGAIVPMRKTKVQKIDANGDTTLYEVLVPEGQAVDGEVADTTELPDAKPVVAAPGTVIEGVGVANEEGVLVAEHLKPSAVPRRNRPPPKKKGGPGRGKKRVTFTNPDGSTYTKIVPNATKIVPQPGQIVKHVAKGEEASADVTAEEAAAAAAARQDDEGSDSEEGEEDGDDEDDREEGEVSDDDAPGTGSATPAKLPMTAPSEMHALPVEVIHAPSPMKDMSLPQTPTVPETVDQLDTAPPSIRSPQLSQAAETVMRDRSSSPDVALATNTHSGTGSTAESIHVALDEEPAKLEQLEPHPVRIPSANEVAVVDIPAVLSEFASEPAIESGAEPDAEIPGTAVAQPVVEATIGIVIAPSAPAVPTENIVTNLVEESPAQPAIESDIEPAIEPAVEPTIESAIEPTRESAKGLTSNQTEPMAADSPEPPVELATGSTAIPPPSPTTGHLSEPSLDTSTNTALSEKPEAPILKESIVEKESEGEPTKVENGDDDLLGSLEKYAQPEG